jgi:endonuclease/exonuclease/phosphatase family metal-dependent hydrolase
MKKLILVVFIFSSFTISAIERDGKKLLRVMSYNMHGIPCIHQDSYSEFLKKLKIKQCPDNTYWSRTINKRFLKLEEILKSMKSKNTIPDVLVLQEAFSSKLRLMNDHAVEKLINSGIYAYHSKGPRSYIHTLIGAGIDYLIKGMGIMDSGLVILSKYPIKKSKRIPFRNCAGFDCLSNKGVAYAQIELPWKNSTVDIFNTHYQAGREKDDERIYQNTRFEMLLNRNKRSPWVIAVGDYNFRKNGEYPSFNDFVVKTRMQYTGEECLSDSNCVIEKNTKLAWLEGTLLDHQFTLARDKNNSIKPVYFQYGRHKFKKGFLTDHYFLIIDYDLN